MLAAGVPDGAGGRAAASLIDREEVGHDTGATVAQTLSGVRVTGGVQREGRLRRARLMWQL